MNRLKIYFSDIYTAWKNEFRIIFRDKGVLIFLFLVPLAYPIVYALIYNPELTRDVPVAVVDKARSERSREFVRLADASESVMIAGYAANLQEAKKMMADKKAYGIVVIDKDFSKKIERGEQAVVSLYCDMSLLIRYKSLLMGFTDASMQIGSRIQFESIARLGASAPKIPPTVSSSYFALGNPEQGFATFLLPGILVLIVQQTLILSICTAGDGAHERRRNGVADAVDKRVGSSSLLIGKALTYLTVYVVPLIWLLLFMPWVFRYPQLGGVADILLLSIPYVLAVSFLGMSLQVFVRERETSFLVIVFSSIIFLFLSGIPWPLYDMDPLYRFASACCPSTWAMQGFARMNANGATLADVGVEYNMLWMCAGVYFILAYAVNKFSRYGMLRYR